MEHFLKKMGRRILSESVKTAIAEQGLGEMYERLERILPDISDQYSNKGTETEFLLTRVRALHAFQISLVQKALQSMKYRKIRVIDIGDSSGNHLLYLKNMYKNIDSLSINLDEHAIRKIRKKGLKALNIRAEDLTPKSIGADVLMLFETLEHIHDPCGLLRTLSETNCKFLVLTVPYVRHSRVGLHHIRKNIPLKHNAENTHLFELSPEDWKLIFKHSGWEVVYEKIYFQYPRRNPLSIAYFYFKNMDFEGFYGAVLKPNKCWKERYTDW